MSFGDRFRAAKMAAEYTSHVQVDPKQQAEHPAEAQKVIALLERMCFLGALAGLEGRGFETRDEVIGKLAVAAFQQGLPPEQVKSASDQLEQAWMAGWNRGAANVRGKA